MEQPAKVLGLNHTMADYTWGWISGTVYFNIPETLSIGNGWGGAGLFTAACGVIGGALGGPPIAAIAIASCAVQSSAIVYTASVAYNSSPHKCLKIKIGLGGIAWPGSYSGSRCHW